MRGLVTPGLSSSNGKSIARRCVSRFLSMSVKNSIEKARLYCRNARTKNVSFQAHPCSRAIRDYRNLGQCFHGS